MKNKISLKIIKSLIRIIPDFPKKGILFRDITTILQIPKLFNSIVEKLAKHYENKGITKVVGIESRGFILGGALAKKLNAGFVPVRKLGKLPYATYSKSYDLEYGNDSLEIHKDAIQENDVILLHDDLLATGGTTKAVLDLLENFEPKKIYLCYLVELDALQGRKRIGNDKELFSLIHFND
jgi:adenine phosphoribosyltransferase